MLDLSSLDLEEIASALADQSDYEHHWLINPDTGEIAFWTADTGIDGQTHHNQHRPHRSLHGAAPLKPLSEPVDLAQYRVRRHARVGGLINEYRLVA